MTPMQKKTFSYFKKEREAEDKEGLSFISGWREGLVFNLRSLNSLVKKGLLEKKSTTRLGNAVILYRSRNYGQYQWLNI